MADNPLSAKNLEELFKNSLLPNADRLKEKIIEISSTATGESSIENSVNQIATIWEGPVKQTSSSPTDDTSEEATSMKLNIPETMATTNKI